MMADDADVIAELFNHELSHEDAREDANADRRRI
jgi:hypothetical protein